MIDSSPPVLRFEHVQMSCPQVSPNEILSEILEDKDAGRKDSFLVNIGYRAANARNASRTKQEARFAKVGDSVFGAGRCWGSHYTSSCKNR